MAAIGAGWATDAWIEASWISTAWSDVVGVEGAIGDAWIAGAWIKAGWITASAPGGAWRVGAVAASGAASWLRRRRRF